MLFADDIVLIGASPEEVNGRFEVQRKVLEGKGLRISSDKIEHIEYDFEEGNTEKIEKGK